MSDRSADSTNLGSLIARIEAGRSFATTGRPARPDEWGVIKVSAMTWGRFDEAQNKGVPERQPVDVRHEIRTGDLLLSRANTTELVGATVVVEHTRPRLLLSDKSLRLVPRDGVDRRWLRYVLASPESRRQLSSMATGTSDSMRNISQAKLLSLRVPIPPALDEQHRIVQEIEELGSRIDQAVASVARSRRNLGELRSRLTEATLAGGWPVVRLEDVLREPLRNGHSAKAAPHGTIRILTLTAVTTGVFEDANTKLTDADPHRVNGLWLEPGDIFIERSNTPDLVGTAALFTGPRNWAIFPDLLIRVRVNETVVPEWLEVVLASMPARDHFRRRAQGIAGSMPKIDQRAVGDLCLPLPPIAEQRLLLDELNQQLSSLKRVSDVLEATASRAAALQRAILATALRGDLARDADKQALTRESK